MANVIFGVHRYLPNGPELQGRTFFSVKKTRHHSLTLSDFRISVFYQY